MQYRGIRKRQTLSQPATRLYRRDEREGFLLTEDKTIYEFDASGRVQPLADRPEFMAPPFQEALRPRGQSWDSRLLAVAEGGSRLFIADGGWNAEGNYLD